ncbi:hypothetical protein PIIN_05227 [Serendipita indica DSM 11827]|uniref:DUF202 domain-containing protein n=1 Tax=Serendipita indica (strain DSM 11827) TaxID=1109443 RepID=G4TIY1_SERID|nr:hypothetical protein PIIN_05227 [Serendipita indica DSM 11827]
MSLSRIRDLSLIPSTSYTYRGRRRDSYAPLDRAELQELRARMRTYDQAYIRTAIMNLGYSVVVLKLLDTRFHRIGLLFSALGAVLYMCALARRRHSNLDFADQEVPQEARSPVSSLHGSRIFGRPFRTAGNVVLLVSLLVTSTHITLFVLLFHL